MIVSNFKIRHDVKSALLINPPVYDISDFKLEYCQPTGLLRIASTLQSYGTKVKLIDCLENANIKHIIKFYERQKSFIPKYHYGMKYDELEEKLVSLGDVPEEIYITSFATYWYESTRDTITRIRKIFPRSKIIVGGIYPTLLPKHAEDNLNADMIVVGKVANAKKSKISLEHYDSPQYLGVKPSAGCPHNCGYCAQRVLNDGKMSFQDQDDVVDEIEYNVRLGLQQVYMFSENFLYNKRHFKNILRELMRRNIKMRIGAPKGMEPRLLDEEILSLMKEAGWVGIRLALESSDQEHRRKLGRFYNSNQDWENAIDAAIKSGFKSHEIGTFLLYGTPGESIDSIFETAEYIKSMGSYIIPMAFTPVPRSKIYNKYAGLLRSFDLTELMGRLYPFAEINGYTFENYLELEQYYAELNKKKIKDCGFSLDVDNLASIHIGAFAKSELSFAIGA